MLRRWRGRRPRPPFRSTSMLPTMSALSCDPGARRLDRLDLGLHVGPLLSDCAAARRRLDHEPGHVGAKDAGDVIEVHSVVSFQDRRDDYVVRFESARDRGRLPRRQRVRRCGPARIVTADPVSAHRPRTMRSGRRDGSPLIRSVKGVPASTTVPRTRHGSSATRSSSSDSAETPTASSWHVHGHHPQGIWLQVEWLSPCFGAPCGDSTNQQCARSGGFPRRHLPHNHRQTMGPVQRSPSTLRTTEHPPPWTQVPYQPRRASGPRTPTETAGGTSSPTATVDVGPMPRPAVTGGGW
jgi:hypothetical protein